MQDGVTRIIEKIHSQDSLEWAWCNYSATIEKLATQFDEPRLIEIGGGRRPLLSKETIEHLGISYTSNDISREELDLSPNWLDKAHFDIQTPDTHVIAPYEASFDLAFSKMVMEHLPSYERAYRNIFTILRKGGVAISFHPVLYSLPFVVNLLIPERLSASLLTALRPWRTPDRAPKFPAFYSGCRVSPRIQRSLLDIGFSRVWQIPFFGHNYYDRIPIVRGVHKKVTAGIQASRLNILASYAYTIVQK